MTSQFLEIWETWRNYSPTPAREVPLSSTDPIAFRPRNAVKTHSPHGSPQSGKSAGGISGDVTGRSAAFDRRELNAILAVYGRKVAAGEWRDYAIDISQDKAVFSIFRRASECPLFTVEKCPRLSRKQGAYSVVALSGLILKRGHELDRVLAVLE